MFEFRLRLGNDAVTRQPIRLSHTWTGPKKQVGAELAKWVTEQRNKTPSTSQTLNWAVERWFTHQEGRASEPTLRTYRSYFATWIKPDLGLRSLDTLTPGDLEDLHARMEVAGKSPSTIRQVHAILRGSLRYARAHRLVAENVALDAPPPKLSATKVVAATTAEVDKLYKAAGPPGSDLPTVIALAAFTGARLGELCSLRWSSVQGNTLRIDRTKTHQVQVLPMSAVLAERIEERMTYQRERAERIGTTLADDPYLLSFWSTAAQKPDASSYSHAFARLRDELGMKHLHLHSLRHSAATWMLDAGVDLVTVAKILGHRDTSMVGRVYGHETPESLRRGVDALARALNP